MRKNLLVYPEGHRNYAKEKHLELKKGMITYAYERGMKVQIVMSFGNEKLLNERNFTVNFEGTTIVSHIGDVLDPKKYPTEKEFYDEICNIFDKDYKKTFAYYKNFDNNVKNNKE